MSVILIYIYFIICFLILFYTIGYIVYQRYYQNHEARLIKQYVNLISDQHLMLQQVGCIDENHCLLLSKRLKNINQLIAFEKALNQLESKSDENTDYLMQIESTIIELTNYYQQLDQMKQAYLAYFIAKYGRGQWQSPSIYRILVSYLDNPTIYLRENVLLATYQQPEPKWIIKVLHYLTENELFHHSKLIQDGLLTYPFDCEELIDRLWEERQTFHPSIFLGLIGYITFKSDRYKETFYQMLQQEKVDLEVKASLMRYFKKHHLPKVEPLLIALASDEQDPIRIVAAYVLRDYPSKNVIATLKESLTDSNWHVRRNASQSLLAMNISEIDISDVLNGEDRYAKEMFRYHLQAERRTAHEPIG